MTQVARRWIVSLSVLPLFLTIQDPVDAQERLSPQSIVDIVSDEGQSFLAECPPSKDTALVQWTGPTGTGGPIPRSRIRVTTTDWNILRSLVTADPSKSTTPTKSTAAGTLAGFCNATLQYDQAEQLFARGHFQKSRLLYEKARQVAPTWHKPPFKLAFLALNSGNVDIATHHFREVEKLAPESSEGVHARELLAVLGR